MRTRQVFLRRSRVLASVWSNPILTSIPYGLLLYRDCIRMFLLFKVNIQYTSWSSGSQMITRPMMKPIKPIKTTSCQNIFTLADRVMTSNLHLGAWETQPFLKRSSRFYRGPSSHNLLKLSRSPTKFPFLFSSVSSHEPPQQPESPANMPASFAIWLRSSVVSVLFSLIAEIVLRDVLD